MKNRPLFSPRKFVSALLTFSAIIATHPLLGSGGFFEPRQFSAGNGFPIAPTVADLNKDGAPDLVVTNQSTASWPCS